MLPIQFPRDNNELNGRRTNWVLAKLNQHMRLYGYELIDLPIIDSADLFLVKAGDQVINSLFTFERHGKQLALRPEFTAAAADYFANTQGNPVARWQFAGSIFEDKSHEFSNKFEQLGIGAELIGLGGSLAESEIIAMSASGLGEIGVQNVHITLGHVGLLREIIRQFNLDARTQRFLLHQISALNDPQKGTGWILEQFENHLTSSVRRVPSINSSLSRENFEIGLAMPVSDSAMTMGGRTQEDIVRRMKLKQQRLADRENVTLAVEHLAKWCQLSGDPGTTLTYLSELVASNDKATQLLREWKNIITLLDAQGISLSSVTIKPDLARSWEYYTGMVFELHGDDIHLGGGGRYDELARLVGSKTNTPSVGFAYYGDRLMSALHNISSESESIITISGDESDMIGAVTWANNLRERGLSVRILPRAFSFMADTHTISIESATTAQFQTTMYSIDQIELLINKLKQAS